MLRLSKIKLNQIKDSLIVINPWLFFLNLFSEKNLRWKYSAFDCFTLIILFFFGIVSFFYTLNIKVIPEIFGTFFLISIRSSTFQIPKERVKIIIFFIRLYLYVGSIIALTSFFIDGGRVGIYGGETNFTGFTILIFNLIILIQKKLNFLDVIFWFTMVPVTGSRAFLLMSILSIIFFLIKSKKIVIGLFLICFSYSFFSLEYIVDLFQALPIFQKSGYVNDISRFASIYDSSSIYRLQIFYEYIDYFNQNILDIFIGAKNSGLKDIFEMKPHNSFIQKVFEYGIILTSINIIYFFKTLPFWIFSIVFIYGFFLHNIFSVPLIIFVALYAKRSLYNNTSI
jgi:hypothetical protein